MAASSHPFYEFIESRIFSTQINQLGVESSSEYRAISFRILSVVRLFKELMAFGKPG
jgi:hypothetical protein